MLKEKEVKLLKGEEPTTRIQSSSSPLPDLFPRFTDCCQNNYSPAHSQSDLSRLTILREFFARRSVANIQAITPGLYEEFESTVLRGRKPKTRKNHLALLKTILNHAVEWGMTDRNPLAKVKPPKVVKTFHFFSKEEISKLVKAAKEPLKTGIIILINPALRRSKLFNLRWWDVDLKTRKLRVWPYEGFTPKGMRPRSIPVNNEALEALRKLKEKKRIRIRIPSVW